jgi:hypothetical protein
LMGRWLVGVLCIGLLLIPQAVAAACKWSVVPNSDGYDYALTGVAAISPTDAWAVGSQGSVNSSDINPGTLIEHWNGVRWTVVPSPSAVNGSRLVAVAALARNDVWAVGYTGPWLLAAQRLIEHWDGSRWKVVPGPNNILQSPVYTGVAAVSSKDVWAIGNDYSGPNVTILNDLWNGARWVPVPSPGGGSGMIYMSGVAAISARDVWAVGTDYNNCSPFCTYAEHWNGNRWSIASPPRLYYESFLGGVTAVSANDVWAVGYKIPIEHAYEATLTEHWNGSSWVDVSSPTHSMLITYLDAVSAVSISDVWAVGYADNHGTLTLHWNGRAWSIVPSPDPGGQGTLYGVAAISSGDVLAVGNTIGPPSHAVTLQYHCSGARTQ